MGLWVRSPRLLEGETVVWRRAANRAQSSRRAVGGRLFITKERLLFEPNRLETSSGGQRWECPLTNISRVTTEARGRNLLSGGLRTRLRLDLNDGSTEVFVVNHVQEVMELVRGAVEETGHNP